MEAPNKGRIGRAGAMKILLWSARAILVAAVIGLIIWFVWQFRDMTAADMVAYTPDDLVLGARVVLAMYAVKSVSIVFPLHVLFIGVGLIFSPVEAFLINAMGSFVCAVLPYWVGRATGKEVINRLMLRYHWAEKVLNIQEKNAWFFTFLLRLVGLLPGDVISMVLGSTGIPFWQYVTASVVGMLPGMVTTTFLGVTATDPTSPAFIASCIAKVMFMAAACVLYRWMVRHKSQDSEEPASEETEAHPVFGQK